MKIALFWHRRDLRLEENAGLFHALKSGYPVLPLFIFDREILDELDEKDDKRVSFIHHYITKIKKQLEEMGSTLLVKYGKPTEIWAEILEKYEVAEVYTNHDYEPYAIHRDATIGEYLLSEGIGFKTFKDQCIYEKTEVVKNDGKPYLVYSPYGRKWRAKLEEEGLPKYPTETLFNNFLKTDSSTVPSLEEMGFTKAGITFPSEEIKAGILKKYAEQRNFPAIEGTSRLSVHLRFGTISIRDAVREGLQHSDSWLNELTWRDFYMMILSNFPHVENENFNKKYDVVPWRKDEEQFEAWCEGRTGYPIVDAGMRELNETGFMHNRVRMIVASFLTKHLFLDWRWGERYFAKKLLDYDLSANNGGWQWAAGTGTDAQPYFRVFNPYSQTEKFDPKLKYIRKWVPEFQEFSYPKPIVDHKFGRERAINTFKEALNR